MLTEVVRLFGGAIQALRDEMVRNGKLTVALRAERALQKSSHSGARPFNIARATQIAISKSQCMP